MDAINFLLALAALIVAAVAFGRTGGIRMVGHRVEEAREMAANALEKIEDVVRPREEVGAEQGDARRSEREAVPPRTHT